MKMLNRVIKVRTLEGDDVTRNYPVFRYESLQEAIASHGEHEILEAFHYCMDMRAAMHERQTLLASLRKSEEGAK